MLKTIAGVLAAAGLLTCLGVPVAYFRGVMDEAMFQWLFVLGSMGWFVFAIVFVSRK